MRRFSRRHDRAASRGRGLAASLAMLLLVGLSLVAAPSATAVPANLAAFDPGYIISDQNMYDSGSMSVADVQAFLDARGAACRTSADGIPCLKAVRADSYDRVADAQCPGGYAAQTGLSAAQVIVGVAQACGINPRVILVTLQKEQSLVTRTTVTANNYKSAMGAGCPDTAACDAQYYWLFNQVYRAAWLLRNYAVKPQAWHRQVGVVNTIAYSPDATCGSSGVLIRNQATASLYNYTPYQPNPAALEAGYGTAACGAYGNRNFFAYYTDWFGAPNGVPPIGSVDARSATNTSITVQGWALDPDTWASVQAHVYVDGVGYPALADQSRPDVATVYGRGDKHGFVITAPARPGPHAVCTFAISADAGPNTLLDCSTVVVPDTAPIGVVDAVTTTASSITIAGWTLDPDTWASNQAHVYIDGVGVALQADLSRPDIAAAFGRGDRHGFTYTAQAAPGRHDLCVYGINTVAGPNALLTCRTVYVNVPITAPFGSVDSIVPSNAGVTVWGWTIDPDTNDPTDVHIYIDGTAVVARADQSRPDVAAAFGHGDKHGFSSTRALGAGAHSICVYAINTGPGAHTMLNCSDFTVRDATPIGSVDAVTATPGSVSIWGWTLDPDTSDPIAAHIYIDGTGVSIPADQSRPDVAAAFGHGDRHGFSYTKPLAAGAHAMCAYGISSSGGANAQLLCRSFVVP